MYQTPPENSRRRAFVGTPNQVAWRSQVGRAVVPSIEPRIRPRQEATARQEGASRPFGLPSLTHPIRRSAGKRPSGGAVEGPRFVRRCRCHSGTPRRCLRGSQQGPSAHNARKIRRSAKFFLRSGSPRSPLLPPYPVSPTGKGCSSELQPAL